MSNMIYEGFVRGAFSIEKNNQINRGEDPAALAEADVFGVGSLEEVKTGAAYAMGAYTHHIINNSQISVVDRLVLDNCLKDVINANDKSRIIDEIKKYRSIRDKYFKFRWQE